MKSGAPESKTNKSSANVWRGSHQCGIAATSVAFQPPVCGISANTYSCATRNKHYAFLYDLRPPKQYIQVWHVFATTNATCAFVSFSCFLHIWQSVKPNHNERNSLESEVKPCLQRLNFKTTSLNSTFQAVSFQAQFCGSVWHCSHKCGISATNVWQFSHQPQFWLVLPP